MTSLGTNRDGNAPIANGWGIGVLGASNNFIGGDPNAGNLISSNRVGIAFGPNGAASVPSGNTVSYNFIGTDSGNPAMKNEDGVALLEDVTSTTISNNTISWNVRVGILMGSVTPGSSPSGNTIYQNKIGTDRDGNSAVPNRHGIILVFGSNNNTISGNLISGNDERGIWMGEGIAVLANESLKGLIPKDRAGVAGMPLTENNTVQGNLIGTDKTGNTANQPSSLRQAGNGADLLIITQREYFSTVESLKALRESQGLSVAVVDIEDIYDEFSFGNHSPQAVKDFSAYAARSWKKKPRFVLLAGDASFDPKNYMGLGGYDHVPTKLLDTVYMETASDDWFADFDNDGVPELAVGRLPFRNAAEASMMIAKIVGYEQSSPSEEVLLVADSNDGFDFEQASAELIGTIPTGLKVNQINRGTDTAAAKSRLMDAVNRGQKLVNYAGHGSVTQWRGNLLVNEDAAQMKNTDRLSVFVMMTCLNGYFDDPALDSLAESLLKAERGGAVAVWSSSGMTLPGDQGG